MLLLDHGTVVQQDYVASDSTNETECNTEDNLLRWKEFRKTCKNEKVS